VFPHQPTAYAYEITTFTSCYLKLLFYSHTWLQSTNKLAYWYGCLPIEAADNLSIIYFIFIL